jgi:hypothetical protein
VGIYVADPAVQGGGRLPPLTDVDGDELAEDAGGVSSSCHAENSMRPFVEANRALLLKEKGNLLLPRTQEATGRP